MMGRHLQGPELNLRGVVPGVALQRTPKQGAATRGVEAAVEIKKQGAPRVESFCACPRYASPDRNFLRKHQAPPGLGARALLCTGAESTLGDYGFALVCTGIYAPISCQCGAVKRQSQSCYIYSLSLLYRRPAE